MQLHNSSYKLSITRTSTSTNYVMKMIVASIYRFYPPCITVVCCYSISTPCLYYYPPLILQTAALVVVVVVATSVCVSVRMSQTGMTGTSCQLTSGHSHAGHIHTCTYMSCIQGHMSIMWADVTYIDNTVTMVTLSKHL